MARGMRTQSLVPRLTRPLLATVMDLQGRLAGGQWHRNKSREREKRRRGGERRGLL